MRKRLIFRVDDLGYTEAYDLGAVRAFDEGIASSADIMLDSPHTVQILEWVKDKPWLSIGWHRHLWESPVLPPEEVPSLVDERGRFKWGHRHPERIAEATYEDAYKEFEAEANLCYYVTGRYPDVASAHDKDLPLEKAFKDVLDKHHIVYGHYTTTPDHKFQAKCDEKYKHLKLFSVNAFPGSYDLGCFSEYQPLKTMTALQWTEEEETYFYGWHPGYCDAHIMAESTCNLHRCKELEAAISDELKQWVIQNKIELVNQRDVLYGTDDFQNHLKAIGSPLWIGNL